MSFEQLFPAAEREALRLAVVDLERRTTAEIVPFVVPRSDAYAQADWKSMALGALLGSLAAAAFHRFGEVWGFDPSLWIAVPPIVGAALGWFAARLPIVARVLAGSEVIDLRVRRRAEAAFLAEELFATERREGVLLFVSLFERRVLVLADVGFRGRIGSPAWTCVALSISERLKTGGPAAALLAGVERIGVLLNDSGLTFEPAATEGTNELPDDLRLEER